MANGREQKLEFIKWCLGGGAVILGIVILLSFLQEFIKRRIRAYRLKKCERPPLCSSGAFHQTEKDPEAAEVSMRNSLVVKKYECDFDIDEMSETLRVSDSTLNSNLNLLSSRSLGCPPDIERKNSKEGSTTESSSEEGAPPMRPSVRRLSSVFRASISNLSNLTDPGELKRSNSEDRVCRLCNMEFHSGDDIGESSNPRCKHIFHKHCITAWLPYQNTCPTCSEPFVILNM